MTVKVNDNTLGKRVETIISAYSQGINIKKWGKQLLIEPIIIVVDSAKNPSSMNNTNGLSLMMNLDL